jgi:hypothetical protein
MTGFLIISLFTCSVAAVEPVLYEDVDAPGNAAQLFRIWLPSFVKKVLENSAILRFLVVGFDVFF